MVPLGNPLERAVDRTNALVRTGAQAAELAASIVGGTTALRANPRAELHRMQTLAAQIDARIEAALEADRKAR